MHSKLGCNYILIQLFSVLHSVELGVLPVQPSPAFVLQR